VHRVVKWHRDRRRQGTHSSKTRAEVSGTGRKPYAQKGTGMFHVASPTDIPPTNRRM
jgi:ribosomal protein L4